jgi:hypothetical protein
MGVGPNYALDKGFLATGATAYAQFEIVRLIVNPNASLNTVMNAIQRETAAVTNATANLMWGVVQEPLDAIKLGTGKAILGTRLMGISRVLTGAAVPLGRFVTSDATARAVAVTRATAGALPTPCLGYALTAASAAGQYIDVLLTPGEAY